MCYPLLFVSVVLNIHTCRFICSRAYVVLRLKPWHWCEYLACSLTFTGLVQGHTLSHCLLFLPFLPVNQTGVKRRLISPLSGWQCLGDRPIVADWMLLSPFPSCLSPFHIFFDLNTFLLTLPPSSPLYHPFYALFLFAMFASLLLCSPVLSLPDPSPLSCLCSPFPLLHWVVQRHQRELISTLLPG